MTLLANENLEQKRPEEARHEEDEESPEEAESPVEEEESREEVIQEEEEEEDGLQQSENTFGFSHEQCVHTSSYYRTWKIVAGKQGMMLIAWLY
jgi:hypothetical protein